MPKKKRPSSGTFVRLEGMRRTTEMRVLCVHPIWAWLIVNGYKDVENRNNPPPKARIGQRVLILATNRVVTKRDFYEFQDLAKRHRIKKGPKSQTDFPLGKLIGSVVLESAVNNSKSRWAERGKSHWILTSPRKMRPREMRGQQTLFFKIRL